MGSGQSRAGTRDAEKVFRNDTAISFSPDVVNRLSDQIQSSETFPERQSTLDSIVRSKIRGELEHLKQQEELVRQEIENALEKENLDRERRKPLKESEESNIPVEGMPSSLTLISDLKELQDKVDRFQTRRELSDFPDVKLAGNVLVECYKAHVSTPLDCWREVEHFKLAVSEVEMKHFQSLR